jgi:hypothetical protein
MNRLIILAGLAISCIITAVINVVIQRMTGFSIYGFKIWFIIPVGAIFVGAFAGVGGLLAARLFNVVTKWIDAFSMVLCSALAMFLIYYIDYITYVIDGDKIANYVKFEDFVRIMITEVHMVMGRGAKDTGAVGELGYFLAIVNFVGFLVGGLTAFVGTYVMRRCKKCDLYLRNIASTSSGIVTLDEADKILHVFKSTSFEGLEYVLRWQAPTRSFEKEQSRARLIYTLYACPKCKQETITEAISISNGGDWKEIGKLADFRLIADGLSLREAMAAPKDNDLSVFAPKEE